MEIEYVGHPLLAPSPLQGLQLAKNVIFGVAVVFPMVITFGVDVPAPRAGTLLFIIIGFVSHIGSVNLRH